MSGDDEGPKKLLSTIAFVFVMAVVGLILFSMTRGHREAAAEKDGELRDLRDQEQAEKEMLEEQSRDVIEAQRKKREESDE
jgi:hypothetical protein